MHVLYKQSDFKEDECIVDLTSKQLYYVNYIWLSNTNVDILLANTNILTELTELEYYGKFRRAYKNEGLKDE